jgi:hypothetical protein
MPNDSNVLALSIRCNSLPLRIESRGVFISYIMIQHGVDDVTSKQEKANLAILIFVNIFFFNKLETSPVCSCFCYPLEIKINNNKDQGVSPSKCRMSVKITPVPRLSNGFHSRPIKAHKS